MTDPKKDNSVKIVVNRETEHELDQFGVKLEGSGVDAVSTAEAEDVEAVICSYPYMSLFEDDVRCVWFRHLSSPSCSLRPAKNMSNMRTQDYSDTTGTWFWHFCRSSARIHKEKQNERKPN